MNCTQLTKHDLLIKKKKKEKTLNKGNREEKRKDQSPKKRQHSKTQMHNWELKEKSSNLGPKPITCSMKQVVQGDEQKKPEKTPSLVIFEVP